jgi:hypothetical protein
MTDIVFNSGDYATLLNEAETLGFVTTDAEGNKSIIVNGTFESGGGWFLNIVGTIYDTQDPPVARDGYWGRLRLNGTPQDMPTFSSAITQYVYQGEWVNAATGEPAPDYVANVGVIA